MKTLERQTMPTTIEHMQGAELPPFLQKKFNVKPEQFLKITVEVEEDDEDVNVGDDLIEGLKEIINAKKQGIKLPNARDLLNSL